jgi:hemerythrin-like metal-binding protein
VKNVGKGVQTARGSQTAMEEIQTSSQKVREMIAGLSQSMEEQVAGVAKLSVALSNVSDMSQNISAATDEQSASTRQVAKAVENVNEVTQTAAASAEQMSAATERLSSMAQELQKLVDQFTIDAEARRREDFFPWSESLSVGLRGIDQQHRRLVDMVNALYRGMIGNSGQESQKTVIHEMVAYADTHFSLEEDYMRRFSFEGREAHTKAHDSFRKKANDLQQRSEGAGFVLSQEIVDFLKGWLQNHIMGTDKQYSESFARHGVV